MPLILLSGYPCSGLTHRATQLHAALSAKLSSLSSSSTPNSFPREIILVSNHALSLPRSSYASARAEKDARAAYYSDLKRALARGPGVIIIADGLNYIKGYRYQIFCEAKAQRVASCVLHVGTRAETCRARNQARLSAAEAEAEGKEGKGKVGGAGREDAYDAEVFDNLVFRYEEPNGMARWDSPLFVVVEDDVDVPADAIWAALVGDDDTDATDDAAPRAGGATAADGKGGRKPVRPNAATVLKPATHADHLYALDATTSAIVRQLLAWQADHVGEAGGRVDVDAAPATAGTVAGTSSNGGDVRETVHLPATGSVTMPMLQRMRRQFIALNRLHASLDRTRVGPLFVDYLNDQFGAV